MPTYKRLRPCTVNGQKALFHGWYYSAEVIAPSMMVGGHNGGQLACTFGIIELETGDVKLCNVTEIKFVGSKDLMSEYCFKEYPDK